MPVADHHQVDHEELEVLAACPMMGKERLPEAERTAQGSVRSESMVVARNYLIVQCKERQLCSNALDS